MAASVRHSEEYRAQVDQARELRAALDRTLTTAAVVMPRFAVCPECDGVGDGDRPEPWVCSRCGGTGLVPR